MYRVQGPPGPLRIPLPGPGNDPQGPETTPRGRDRHSSAELSGPPKLGRVAVPQPRGPLPEGKTPAVRPTAGRWPAPAEGGAIDVPTRSCLGFTPSPGGPASKGRCPSGLVWFVFVLLCFVVCVCLCVYFCFLFFIICVSVFYVFVFYVCLFLFVLICFALFLF